MPSQTLVSTQNATSRKGSGVAARWLLLLSALWCVCWFVHSWHYWEDDAYIHLEFARNVSLGHGYSFNGLLVNGDTSPLWVLLLVAAHAVIPNWLVAGKALTVAGAVFALAATYCFAKRLAEDSTGSGTFAATMVLLLVVNPYFCYWSFSGMETVTAIGVGFWAVLAAVKKVPAWWSFFAGCFLAGVAPMLRPEMLALTGMVGLLLLAQWWRLGEGLPGKKIDALVLGLALVVIPMALWSIYALHAFGHIFPNTNAAKRAAPGNSVGRRLLFVYGLGFPAILAEIAGAAFLLVRPGALRKKASGIPAASWVFAAWCVVGAVFYEMDHTWVQTRYIFVMAPGLMIAMLAFNYRRLPRWAYRASLTFALIAALAVDVSSVWLHMRNNGIHDTDVAQISAYVKNDLPEDGPLAAYSIGEIAFDSQHPVIDIGGITRPGVIPYLMNGTGDEVTVWAYRQGARYMDSGAQPVPGATLVYSRELPSAGWSLNPKYYAGTEPVRIWKLPDMSAAALPAR